MGHGERLAFDSPHHELEPEAPEALAPDPQRALLGAAARSARPESARGQGAVAHQQQLPPAESARLELHPSRVPSARRRPAAWTAGTEDLLRRRRQ